MVVFAGTFDPITKGHEDIIYKCVQKYGDCLVVVGHNKDKTPFFSQDERVDFVKKTFEDSDKIKVVNYLDYKENYGEFLSSLGVKLYARGIRNRIDKKYEKASAKLNKKLYPQIKTVYIKTKKYNEVSSTLVKELMINNKDTSEFLPEKSRELILKTLKEKLVK